MPSFRSSFAGALLCVRASACVFVAACLAYACFAYPPAPGVVVYGVVKDANGKTVDGPNAFVVFKSGDTEIARVALNGRIDPTESYRALLPSDMSSGGDGYREEVLDAALPFTVQVQIGLQLFDPIETVAGLAAPDERGSAIRLDFSLGTDSDGDGLPDEWERRLLERLGYQEGDDGYTLDLFAADLDYDGDGLTDRQEYLAGTFAYLTVDALSVEPRPADEAGRFQISLLAVEGAAYALQGSRDGRVWETVEFWVTGDDALPHGLVSSFEAADTRILTVQVKREDVERMALFRVKLY